MTDQELKDLIASFAVAHEKSVAEADRRFARLEEQVAKTDAQLAKTDAQLKKLSEMIGGIVNNQGQVAEEFFYQSLGDQLQVANIKFDVIYRNLSGRVNGLQDEFDLILVNGDTLAMFEVKTKAHLNLIDTMLQRKIPNLRKVLPHFKNYKVYAGIASLVTYDELIEQTKNHGLFLLTQQGTHLEVVNETVTYF
jgi:Holliday junction resolvase-like predicted endonuclease